MACKKDQEIWKPVVGYEGLYEVSSKGRVKSYNRFNGKILKTCEYRGYKKLNLYKNKKRKSCWVHRLVAEAFLGPCPDGMVVCHGVGGVCDNSAENLRYDTEKENSKDILRFEADKKLKKLSKNDVIEILERLKNNENNDLIARDFFISVQHVESIKKGSAWSRVSGKTYTKKKVRFVTPEDENKIVELRLAGNRQKDIAKSTGFDQTTISKVLIKNGIRTRKK